MWSLVETRLAISFLLGDWVYGETNWCSENKSWQTRFSVLELRHEVCDRYIAYETQRLRQRVALIWCHINLLMLWVLVASRIMNSTSKNHFSI